MGAIAAANSSPICIKRRRDYMKFQRATYHLHLCVRQAYCPTWLAGASADPMPLSLQSATSASTRSTSTSTSYGVGRIAAVVEHVGPSHRHPPPYPPTAATEAGACTGVFQAREREKDGVRVVLVENRVESVGTQEGGERW